MILDETAYIKSRVDLVCKIAETFRDGSLGDVFGMKLKKLFESRLVVRRYRKQFFLDDLKKLLVFFFSSSASNAPPSWSLRRR